MDSALANLQYVIGIIASFAMVGLKKIKLIDANKTWVIPLLMIATCVLACFFNDIPNWLMAGTTMALAICKVRDWVAP